MTKTIKLDNNTNYLVDKSTNTLVPKYDPNNKDLELVIQLDDSTLIVSADKILTEYGDQVVVRYNDDLFIIDDGYQPTLTKAGYIVFQNYDSEMVLDKFQGQTILDEINRKAEDAIMTIIERTQEYSYIDDNIQTNSYEFNHNGFKYTVRIDSVTKIVSKNQLRKDNSLPFYPFDKRMDKYGTIYCSIFAQKIDPEANLQEKYEVANNFIKNLLVEMGSEYHFIPQAIKRRIIMAKGL